MRRLLITTSLVSGLVFFGCNKPSETPPAALSVKGSTTGIDRVLSTDIVKKLPTTTAGFYLVDFSSDGFQNYKKIAPITISSMNYLDKVGAELAKTSPETGKIIEAFKAMSAAFGFDTNSGEISIDKNVSQFLAYGDVGTTGKVEDGSLALLLSAASGSNIQTKLPAIEGFLKEAGLTFTQESVVPGTKGLTIDITTEGTSVGSMYISASEKMMAGSHKKEVLTKLFSSEEPNGITSLRAAPEFDRATKAVAYDDATMAFAYVSLAKVIPLLKVIEEQSKQEGATGDVKPEEIPVQSVAVNMTAGDLVTQQLAVVTDAKNDTQRDVFKALEGSKVPAITQSLPAGTAFAVGLDVSVLAKTKAIMDELAKDESMKMASDLVKNLIGTTLAIRNNDAGSPFPDLFLEISANNREALIEMIKTGVTAAAATGMPSSPWQEKDIAGTPATFMSTPLGVGLYMSKPKDSTKLLVASSERALKDAIAADGTAVKDSVTKRIGNGDGFLTYKIDFNEVGNVVDSVKGNLAMFTGGAGGLDSQIDTKQIRELGLQAGILGFKDGIVKFSSFQDMTKPKVQG